jgi:hypothetical protein
MITLIKKSAMAIVVTMGLVVGGNCSADVKGKTVTIFLSWTGVLPIAAVTYAAAKLGNWSDKVKVARIARYSGRTAVVTCLPLASALSFEVLTSNIDKDNPYKENILQVAAFPCACMVQIPAIKLQQLEDKYNNTSEQV